MSKSFNLYVLSLNDDEIGWYGTQRRSALAGALTQWSQRHSVTHVHTPYDTVKQLRMYGIKHKYVFSRPMRAFTSRTDRDMNLLKTRALFESLGNLTVAFKERAMRERRQRGLIIQLTDLDEPATCMLDVGEHVLMGCTNGNIAVYQKNTRRPIEIRKTSAPSVSSLTFVKRSMTIWGTSKDNKIYVWSVRSGEMVRVLDDHKGRVTALLPVDDCVWSTSIDVAFRVWNPKTYELLKTVSVQEFMIFSIYAHGQHVWFGTESAIMRWDKHTYKPVDLLKCHRRMVHCLISVGDKRVWSASADRTICVWDTESSECVAQIYAHDSRVTHLLHVPGSQHVYSCSPDKSIKLWHAQTFECLRSINMAHDDAVTALLYVNQRQSAGAGGNGGYGGGAGAEAAMSVVTNMYGQLPQEGVAALPVSDPLAELDGVTMESALAAAMPSNLSRTLRP